MDDYTFPFLLALAMSVICTIVAIAHGYGL
jgi:hypothetical protein